MDIFVGKYKFPKTLFLIGFLILLTVIIIYYINSNSDSGNKESHYYEGFQPVLDINGRVIHTNYQFFASKSGKYFYNISCESTTTIRFENRVYFRNSEEATLSNYYFNENCR